MKACFFDFYQEWDRARLPVPGRPALRRPRVLPPILFAFRLFISRLYEFFTA
jgi:hypothetical protein